MMQALNTTMYCDCKQHIREDFTSKDSLQQWCMEFRPKELKTKTTCQGYGDCWLTLISLYLGSYFLALSTES